jgi:ATP synthase protein I
MPQNGPDHDDLRALGAQLDEVRRRDDARKVQPPPTSLGIAFRFSTELFAATIVGAGLGWGLDRLIGTKYPVFMLVLGMLGAVAGVRNVMRAAKEINAQAAPKPDEEK